MDNDTPDHSAARKLTLPQFSLTQLRTGYRREHPIPSFNNPHPPNKQAWMREEYEALSADSVVPILSVNLMPVILAKDGLPWIEANVYLISCLHNSVKRCLSTLHLAAGDLVAYRRFLDAEGIDWLDFPAQKLSRPTYRYLAHLHRAVQLQCLAQSTARRRMSAVVGFYRWLIDEGEFRPTYPPWRQSDRYFSSLDSYGNRRTRHVVAVDVAIPIVKEIDPFSDCIDDGGKLRPLPLQEQKWVIEALSRRRNTEMTLIHVIALATGARMQTILTMKVRHVLHLMTTLPVKSCNRVPCLVGAGAGIDTKNDKKIVIYFPLWLCELLNTYLNSPRARKRRSLVDSNVVGEKYLFLSKSGRPYYRTKEEYLSYDENIKDREMQTGGSIRTFIGDVIIPYVRKNYDKSFHYRFHDLRASFGMAELEIQLDLVEKGVITLLEALEHVKNMLSHESLEVTNRYLRSSRNKNLMFKVIDEHDFFLRGLAEEACR